MSEFTNKAIAHVVKMLEGKGGEAWDGDSAMFEGICGWNGVMSPMNRKGFVQSFGETLTATLEKRAREVLDSRAEFWENSKAKGYEKAADEAELSGPMSLEVGSFVWGVMDGCKCDHERLSIVLEHLLEDEREGLADKRLCKIVRIEDVAEITPDILKGWKPMENEGGAATDDVSDEELGSGWQNYSRLTDEQKRTTFTLCVLIRDAKGRYFMVDPEGYSYARYVILPMKWRGMYGDMIAEVEAEKARREKASAEAKAAKVAERRAAYEARCAKWEGLMEEMPKEIRDCSYLPDFRKVAKRNVLAMAKHAFPWVRFSVSYDRGWGNGYRLSWKNGPTVEEVKKACDFDLFAPWWDTFDGMTDCAGTAQAEFTDFADRFGGIGNGVDFRREECETDRNGDPNKPKQTKEVAPSVEKSEGGAVITENVEKNGIEIRFPSIPSEDIRALCKDFGFRWSRFGRCWYNRNTERNAEAAKAIVVAWNNENSKAVA